MCHSGNFQNYCLPRDESETTGCSSNAESEVCEVTIGSVECIHCIQTPDWPLAGQPQDREPCQIVPLDIPARYHMAGEIGIMYSVMGVDT